MFGAKDDRREHGRLRPSKRPVGRVQDTGQQKSLLILPLAGAEFTGPDQVRSGQGQGQQGRGGESDALRLGIPKNKSTSNLAFVAPDNSEKARMRMSFDAGAAASDGSFSR